MTKKAGFRRLFLFLLVLEGLDSIFQFADPCFHEVQHHKQEDDEQTADGGEDDGSRHRIKF